MKNRVWATVGDLLQTERLRRGWGLRMITQLGGPQTSIVRAHERGEIRTTDALERHAQVFDWTAAIVLQAALRADKLLLSADELSLIAAYRKAGDQRPLVRAVAKALARQASRAHPPDGSAPADPRGAGGGMKPKDGIRRMATKKRPAGKRGRTIVRA